MLDGSFKFDDDTADFGYKVGGVELTRTFRYTAGKVKESLAVLRGRAEQYQVKKKKHGLMLYDCLIETKHFVIYPLLTQTLFMTFYTPCVLPPISVHCSTVQIRGLIGLSIA